MRLGHVEVVDGVAERICVGKQLRGRIELQLEGDQPLPDPFLGLHPHLHDAFAHGFGVVVLGDVTDFQKHVRGPYAGRRISRE